MLKKMGDSGKWKIIPMESLQSSNDPDWRIFARSSSDDIGPLAMFRAAWDGLVETTNMGQMEKFVWEILRRIKTVLAILTEDL